MLSPARREGAGHRSWTGPRALLLFLALAASLAAAPPPPPSDPLTPLPVADPKADPDSLLQRLSEEVERIDPSAPDAVPRVRAVVRGLIDVERASRREIAALRAELAALRAPAAGRAAPSAERPSRTGPSATSTATGAGPAPGASTAKPLTTATPNSTSSRTLFGKRGLKKLHRPGCAFGERIRVEDRVTFGSMQEGAAAGYEACKICKPD